MTVGVDQPRVRATWVLCETLLDHLPQARQPSSTLGNLAGLAASRLVPCERCGARGRVNPQGHPCASCVPQTSSEKGRFIAQGRHGCRSCTVCNGFGWRDRRAGDKAWDEYASVELAPRPTGLVNEVKQALALEKERPGLRDAALRRADRVLLEMQGTTTAFGWEVAWERKTKHGSYGELVLALERLRDTEEHRYRAVWRVVVLDEASGVLPPRLQGFLNESMVVLTSMMPERIKVPRWLRADEVNDVRKESLWRGKTPAHRRQRQERDAEVNRLRFEEGWKVARLARHFALSEMQIKRINAAYRSTAELPPAAA